MNFNGIITGAATFLIIGMCHPIVIKLEYSFGKKSWWILLAVGVVLAICSLFIGHDLGATILGAGAFSCFWGIHEMFQQETRVLKGWFPENPKRHAYYEKRRREKGIQPKG